MGIGWVENPSELAQDHRAWVAAIRDAADKSYNFYTIFLALFDPCREVNLSKLIPRRGIPTFLRFVNATEIKP